MREIVLPIVERSELVGCYRAFAVKVDWPELQLTEEQLWQNAVARGFGDPEPFPDPSIFVVKVPY
jgi:hypothetical protein